MRRTIFWLLCIGVILGCMTVVSFAEEPGTVSVQCVSECEAGNTMDVTVRIDGVRDYQAISYRLQYDPSKVAPVSITPTSGCIAQKNASISENEAFVSMTYSEPVSNDGVTAVFTFLIDENAVGDMQFSLNMLKVKDENSGNISVGIVNAQTHIKSDSDLQKTNGFSVSCVSECDYGDTVEVTVNLYGVENYQALSYRLQYDSTKMEIVSIDTASGCFAQKNLHISENEAFVSLTYSEPVSTEGQTASFRFLIKNSAAGNADFRLNRVKVKDEYSSDIACDKQDACVIIRGKKEALLSVESEQSVQSEQSTTVTVSLSDAADYNALSFRLWYDDTLFFAESMQVGSAFSGALTQKNLNYSSNEVFLSLTFGSPVSFNGEVLRVVFRAKPNAAGDASFDLVNLKLKDDESLNMSAKTIGTSSTVECLHTGVEWIVAKEPTCCQDGLSVFDCPCGYIQTEPINKNGKHLYDSVVIDPTEMAEGYTLHSCVWCGESYHDEYTEALGFTIRYDVNGGEGAPSDQNKRYLKDLMLSTSQPYRVGYLFAGWSRSSAAQTAEYHPGDICRSDENMVLYAVWIPVSFTVSAVMEDGITRCEALFPNADEQCSVIFAAYRNGVLQQTAVSRFEDGIASCEMNADWHCIKGFVFDDLSSLRPLAYAVDVMAKYTVSFVTNGGAVTNRETTDSMTSVKYEADGRMFDDIDVFRKGYSFVGWYTDETLTEPFWLNGEDAPVMPYHDITLYACWKANEYSVFFNGNGGTAPSGITVTYDGTYGILPISERAGYTFDGWYTATIGGDRITSATAVSVTADQTLYAHWIAYTYRVIFNPNGGSTPVPADKSIIYDDTYGTLPSVTRIGYTFKGWYTTVSGGVQITSETKVSVTENQTLYAHWIENTYTVFFNANGGNTPSLTSKTVTYDGTYGVLATVSRVGYSFAGWFTATSGGTQITEGAKVAITADQTLYAHWTANTYTVSYNGNGATGGSTANTIHTVDQAKALATNGYTKTGYQFLGWSWNTNGSSGYYANGELVTNLTYTANEEVVLYAGWKPQTYTVTFNANGGTPERSSQSITFDNAYGTLPNATRTGHTLIGWFTSASGGSQITSSTKVTTAANHTLYAHWSANSYSVSWNGVSNGSVTVTRTSSPNKGAATGTLSSGATVYYGDVLSISYAANTGYSLSTKGSTSITVTGNVTSSAIYATTTANNYTYNVVYKSSNGTNLGSTTVTKAFGTTNTISAPAYTGYTTPSSQSVKWDSTSAKTISFIYIPTTVGTQILADNAWWWKYNSAGTVGIKYSISIAYSNRTASSVDATITISQTCLKNSRYGFWQGWTVNLGNASTGVVRIAENSTWNSTSTSDRTQTKAATVTITGLSATTTSVSFTATPTGYQHADAVKPSAFSGTLTIPTY